MRTQRLLAPEVVQTSAMDCGPACLKSLLEGFGIPVSYDRLREACQTDLDGTSVNTIEQVAIELGLEAEQIMLPPDHLLLPETKAIPALVVVRLPTGITHFVIVWRQYGRFLQIMDPATGRQWLAGDSFLDRLYIHAHSVAAADWREWAISEEFISALRYRARRLKLPADIVSRLIDVAIVDGDWRSIAALDAAIRMMRPMVESGGLRNRKTAGRVLAQFFERARLEPERAFEVIPPAYWSVLPMKGASDAEEPQLVFRGAVLIRVRGRRKPECAQRDLPETQSGIAESLLPRLRPAVTSAVSQLVHLLRADGLLAPAAVASALVIAAGGLVFEALLYRILLDLTGVLTLSHQRLIALGMLLGFLGVLIVLDLMIGGQLLRFGRRLELRLRTFLLQKLPRLPDRYFGSRLVSDMAERSHAIHEIRMLPVLGSQLIHHAFELVLTTIGIIWLDPHIAPLVIAAALGAVLLALAAQPVIAERDLRFRTHSGGLARFYFDALRGLVAVRTHGAEEAIRTEHEGHLVNWSRAGLSLQRIAVVLEGVTLIFGTVLTAWILLSHIGRHADSTVGLLLVYWTLNIPVLGRQLAEAALSYPKLRNLTLRLIEPLALPDDPGTSGENTAAAPAGSSRPAPCRGDARDLGVSIVFENASIRAIGQTIVEEFSLTIAPGSHVCIVGLSGAGKSSLLGLLLGWHKPATGRIFIDGHPLDRAELQSLRRQTVWVDPAIQIWNRSLLENLQYGTEPDLALIGQTIDEADLLPLLEALPDGLQTRLGEGGALVSGGEGQRVRLGRALLRHSPRLVILDEPFASLDRERRQELLRRAKRIWRNATLLCVTHDVAESRHFDRVLVMEKGRILEDGAPAVLSSQRSSRFRQLLDSEESVQREVWARHAWRTIRLDHRQIVESIGKRYDDERYRDDVLASAAVGRSAGSVGAERGTSSKTG